MTAKQADDIAAAQLLHVLLYDTFAGELTRREGRVTFRYAPEYQRLADATPLSLSMPLHIAQHGHRVVEPFLWGLLPDSSDVLARWAREFGVSPRSPFALLAHVGQDCAGAVQLVSPERTSSSATADVTWLDDEEIAHLIRMLRRDPSLWRLDGSAGQWSLAGAQAKVALHFADGRWGKPSGRVPTTHILKPAITGIADHDLNEHLCLDLARRLGLTAARSRVGDFAGERVIVVERYDRTLRGGALLRVHQEDLCQAMGLYPDRKYQSDGGPSPEQICQHFRSHAPAAVADRMVRDFVDALILNWLIVGTDAHAKNYSLLLSGTDVRLAPLYDVASALPYDDSDGHRLRLAMKVGGQYQLAYIGRDSWSTLAEAVGLDPAATVARVIDVATRVPAAIRDACAAVEVLAPDRPLIRRLEELVTARSDACLSRMSAVARATGPVETQAVWTPQRAALLMEAVAEPQRRLLAAVAAADGVLSVGDLLRAIDQPRGTLRGLTGPVTKAVQRLQHSNTLPWVLPRPVEARYAMDEQGVRRVKELVMAAGTAASFRAASRSTDRSDDPHGGTGE